MIKRFLLRWAVGALGLWIAAGILQGRLTYGSSLGVLIISGLILALANMIIKPIIIVFSLPAIILTLGLFMIVINGLIVLLVSWLYEPLQVQGFGSAILVGIIIGLVNWLVTALVDRDQS